MSVSTLEPEIICLRVARFHQYSHQNTLSRLKQVEENVDPSLFD